MANESTDSMFAETSDRERLAEAGVESIDPMAFDIRPPERSLEPPKDYVSSNTFHARLNPDPLSDQSMVNAYRAGMTDGVYVEPGTEKPTFLESLGAGFTSGLASMAKGFAEIGVMPTTTGSWSRSLRRYSEDIEGEGAAAYQQFRPDDVWGWLKSNVGHGIGSFSTLLLPAAGVGRVAKAAGMTEAAIAMSAKKGMDTAMFFQMFGDTLDEIRRNAKPDTDVDTIFGAALISALAQTAIFTQFGPLSRAAGDLPGIAKLAGRKALADAAKAEGGEQFLKGFGQQFMGGYPVGMAKGAIELGTQSVMSRYIQEATLKVMNADYEMTPLHTIIAEHGATSLPLGAIFGGWHTVMNGVRQKAVANAKKTADGPDAGALVSRLGPEEFAEWNSQVKTLRESMLKPGADPAGVETAVQNITNMALGVARETGKAPGEILKEWKSTWASRGMTAEEWKDYRTLSESDQWKFLHDKGIVGSVNAAVDAAVNKVVGQMTETRKRRTRKKTEGGAATAKQIYTGPKPKAAESAAPKAPAAAQGESTAGGTQPPVQEGQKATEAPTAVPVAKAEAAAEAAPEATLRLPDGTPLAPGAEVPLAALPRSLAQYLYAQGAKYDPDTGMLTIPAKLPDADAAPAKAEKPEKPVPPPKAGEEPKAEVVDHELKAQTERANSVRAMHEAEIAEQRLREFEAIKMGERSEWMRVSKRDGETVLEDGVPITLGDFESVEARKVITPDNPAHPYAKAEFDAQEHQKPTEAFTLESATPEQLAAEKARQGQKERMAELHGRRLSAKDLETTGNLFGTDQAENPLFATPTPKPAAPVAAGEAAAKPTEFDRNAGPFSVEYGTRSRGNKYETFDDFDDAMEFYRGKNASKSTDHAMLTDANGNEFAEQPSAPAPNGEKAAEEMTPGKRTTSPVLRHSPVTQLSGSIYRPVIIPPNATFKEWKRMKFVEEINQIPDEIAESLGMETDKFLLLSEEKQRRLWEADNKDFLADAYDSWKANLPETPVQSDLTGLKGEPRPVDNPDALPTDEAARLMADDALYDNIEPSDSGIPAGQYFRTQKTAVFFQTATPATFIHEFMHHLRVNGLMPEKMQNDLLAFSGEKEWNAKAEEFVADSALGFFMRGQLPDKDSPGWTQAVSDLRDIFTKAVPEVQRNGWKTSPDTEMLFTRLLEHGEQMKAAMDAKTAETDKARDEANTAVAGATIAAMQNSPLYERTRTVVNKANYFRLRTLMKVYDEKSATGRTAQELLDEAGIPVELKARDAAAGGWAQNRDMNNADAREAIKLLEGQPEVAPYLRRVYEQAIARQRAKIEKLPTDKEKDAARIAIEERKAKALDTAGGLADVLAQDKTASAEIEFATQGGSAVMHALKQTIAKGVRVLTSAENIFRTLDNGDENGVFSRTFWRRMWKASTRQAARINASDKRVSETIERLGGIPDNIYSRFKIQDGQVTRQYTLSELIGIYMHSAGGDIKADSTKALQERNLDVTDGVIKSAKRIVEGDAKSMNLVRTIQDYMNTVREDLNAVVKRVHGREIGDQGRFYLPFIGKDGNIKEMNGLDLLETLMPEGQQTGKGILRTPAQIKERGGGKAPLSLDSLSLFFRYKESTENYIAKAELVQEMLWMLKDERLSSEIVKRHGSDMLNTINTLVEKEMSPSGRLGEMGMGEAALQQLRNKASASYLHMNPFTAAKVPLSLFNAFTEIEITDGLMNFVKSINHLVFNKGKLEDMPEYQQMLKDSPVLKLRAQESRIDPEFQLMYLQRYGGTILKGVSNKNLLYRILKHGAEGMLAMDSATNVAVYTTAKRMALAAGKSLEDAIYAGERAVRKSQSPTMTSERATLQGSNEYYKSGMMFSGQLFKNANQVIYDIVMPVMRAYKAGGTPEMMKAIWNQKRNIVVVTLLPGIAMGMINRRRAQKDMREVWLDIFANDISMIPLFGTPAANLVQGFTGAGYSAVWSDLTLSLDKVIVAHVKGDTSFTSGKDIWNDAKSMSRIIATLTATPQYPVKVLTTMLEQMQKSGTAKQYPEVHDLLLDILQAQPKEGDQWRK